MRVLAAAVAAMQAGQPTALATVVGVDGSAPRHPGSRMLVHPDGSIVGTIGGGVLEHRVIAAAIEVLRNGRPTHFIAHTTRDLGMCCGGSIDVYIEPLATMSPLVIFGAGHVAHAAAPLLVGLNFDVHIVDDRDDLAVPERFEGCTVHCADPRTFATQLQTTPDTYLLVVTHDHALDQDLVEALLHREHAWLGLIGSRAKVAKFLLRYRAAGIDEALLRRLCAPVGLDIGAETPQEIAVSIAAELIRLRRGATDRTPQPMSAEAIPARGGDGTALPYRLERQEQG